MISKIVEVQGEGSGNWGAFQLCQFREEEVALPSKIHPQVTVWGAVRPPTARDIVIWDLRTKEGAMFDTSADLVPQLYRHQIHVCVLFEPFLVWLAAFLRTATFRAIPDVVTLTAGACPPTEVIGWRHGGWIEQLPAEALAYLDSFEKMARIGAVPALPRSLALLVKRLLPTTSPQTGGDDEEAQVLRGRGAERTRPGEQVRAMSKVPYVD